MNTNFSNYKPDYSAFKEYFYVHRVRVSINYTCPLPQNTLPNKLLNLVNSKFVIKISNKHFRNFMDHEYAPLDVKILLPKNGTGPLQPKHWAFIDYVKSVIHVDGEYPEQRVQEFIAALKDNGIELTIERSDYKYVEICCRHPHHTFDKVSEALSRLGHRFGVAKTIEDKKKHPLAKEVVLFIVKDIYFDGYCNLKTYKYIKDFGSSNPSISKEIEPKLEIQINNPKSLEEAQVRGVSILKAITASLGIRTIKMSREFEKNEYTEIPNSEKFSPNEKITSFLNEQEMDRLPSLPDAIRKHKNSYRIVNSIFFVPKRVDQLIAELKLSEATIRRTLKKIDYIIEKRGDRKNGYLLTIDKTKFSNNYELSSISTKHNNKRNNKGKALSVILLLIISANILNSYYFPSYIFTPIKTLEDSFSLKVEDSYLKIANNANFFNRPYEYSPQTGLKDSTFYRGFTYYLGNSTQFKETTYIGNLAKGGKTL